MACRADPSLQSQRISLQCATSPTHVSQHGLVQSANQGAVRAWCPAVSATEYTLVRHIGNRLFKDEGCHTANMAPTSLRNT